MGLLLYDFSSSVCHTANETEILKMQNEVVSVNEIKLIGVESGNAVPPILNLGIGRK